MRLEKIGEFEYPSFATFADALKLAESALKTYGGVIPNLNAAQELGYTVKDAAAISGTIYKRINDLCMFNLTLRERGGLRATPTATEAVDPYDSTKAADGKAKALRSIPLIAKAFDAWSGEMPDETAFPAKLGELTGVQWQEAQRHSDAVRRLLVEAFGYLKSSPTLPPSQIVPLIYGPPVVENKQPTPAPKPQPYGELRTTMGTIVVRDKRTWKIAKELLDALGEEFGVSEEQEKAI